MGNEDVQKDARFANYIIGNMNGLLELKGNCFVENKVTFAPVISHSDKAPKLKDNYGEHTALETCEFAAVFKNTGAAATVSQRNYYCMEYDRTACFRDPKLSTPRDPKSGDNGLILISNAAAGFTGIGVSCLTGLAVLVGFVV